MSEYYDPELDGEEAESSIEEKPKTQKQENKSTTESRNKKQSFLTKQVDMTDPKNRIIYGVIGFFVLLFIGFIIYMLIWKFNVDYVVPNQIEYVKKSMNL